GRGASVGWGGEPGGDCGPAGLGLSGCLPAVLAGSTHSGARTPAAGACRVGPGLDGHARRGLAGRRLSAPADAGVGPRLPRTPADRVADLLRDPGDAGWSGTDAAGPDAQTWCRD